MSVDIENIRGVFADLDDGGLNPSEALDQIRDLVGAEAPPKQLLFYYLVPMEVTVNVEDGEIEEVTIAPRMGERTQRSPTLPDGQDVDEDRWSNEIERAESAMDENEWPEPTIG